MEAEQRALLVPRMGRRIFDVFASHMAAYFATLRCVEVDDVCKQKALTAGIQQHPCSGPAAESSRSRCKPSPNFLLQRWRAGGRLCGHMHIRRWSWILPSVPESTASSRGRRGWVAH